MAIVIKALMKLSKVISFFIYARFVSIAKVLLFYKLRCVMFLKNNNECEKGCFCWLLLGKKNLITYICEYFEVCYHKEQIRNNIV